MMLAGYLTRKMMMILNDCLLRKKKRGRLYVKSVACGIITGEVV
jgi:hypothetical protein